MSVIELHGARTGNCLRASIGFEEAQIPYVVKLVDLRAGQQRSASHLALNPAGHVPTIVEHAADGRRLVLSQSNAILFHLVEKAPGRLLPVNDAPARTLALERFFMVLTEVIGPSHAGFQLVASNPTGAAILDARALAALSDTERFVSETTYMAGDAFSIADVAAFTIAAAYEGRIGWARLPSLRRWFDDVGARPAVTRGMHAFDG